MSETDTMTNPHKPMSHAERGRLGGQASNPRKGFGSPSVSAKAIATLKQQAEERRAKVKAITDQYVPPPAVAADAADAVLRRVPEPSEDLQPYISKPFRSALDVPAEITVIE